MAPSPTIRRLLKETSELSSSSKNPNPAFYAAPVSDNDLHEWHFTLLGPPSPSPYSGGMYHGRISLPPSYPLKPPNFRFLTPSGRFEVNREICLSISGFHEETWMPAWGVRTALTALRSFMAESGTAGQVGGLEASKEVRERLARESRSWRCAECGGRSNEDIMSEWWEACASKGVKVGEDVGLEVLPEGLSLEAKVPSASTEDTSKKEEKNVHENIVNATTQQLSPNRTVESSQVRQDTSHDTVATTPQLTDPIPSQNTTSIPPSQPQSQQPPPTPTPTQQLPANFSRIAPGDPQPLSHQDQNAEANTNTIDRAIYIVLFALILACAKKVFYPATGKTSWEDFAMVRE